jgi:hypothetical protein
VRERERGGATAIARRRVGGAALDCLGEGGREEGERGTWPGGLARPAGLEKRKRKIEIYFEIDFQL